MDRARTGYYDRALFPNDRRRIFDVAFRRNVIVFVGTGVLGAGIGVGLWHALSPSVDNMSADPSDAQLVRLGETLYGAHCASCHGGELEGEPNWRQQRRDGTFPAPPHDETGHT